MASSAQTQMTKLPFRQNMKCFHMFAFFAEPKLCKTYRSFISTFTVKHCTNDEFVEGASFNRLYFMEKICSILGLNKSAVIIHRILPNMMEPVKSRDTSENQLNLKTKHQNRNFYMIQYKNIAHNCI